MLTNKKRREIKLNLLYQEACKVYYDFCHLNKIIPFDPVKEQTKFGRKYIYLKKEFEVIGVYDFITKKPTKIMMHNKLFPVDYIQMSKGIVINDPDSIF